MAFWDYTGYTGKYYCTGATTGVEIWLNGSENGINYRLYRNSTTIVFTKSGTGQPISMGIQNISGNYTIRAFLAGQPSGMTYTNIDLYWNTAPVVRSMTGGGQRYDNDITGLDIGLSSTTQDIIESNYITYNLYCNNNLITQITTTVMTSAITFGNYYSAGTYTSDAFVINSSITYKNVGSQTIVTANTYYCYTSMSGSSVIVVYPTPLITTNPITNVASLTSYANSDVNIPVTYTIQAGSSIDQFRVIINYDYLILKYVNYESLISGAALTATNGIITIDWSSPTPVSAITNEIVTLVFNYKIGDAILRIDDNTFYRFYAKSNLPTIKENGYISLSDEPYGTVSGYKSVADGIGAVIYATVDSRYDIYFDDVYHETITVYEEYRQVYKSDASKITIKGELNKVTRLDLSNNNLEHFDFTLTEFYRLHTLNLDGNNLTTFNVPQYLSTFNIRNNQLSRELVNVLLKKCYESGIYNAILDLRDNNNYSDLVNQYYEALLLKGWNIIL